MHDILIRGGSIHDGSGAEPSVGDVAVRDGAIVGVGGRISEPARQEIDADGAIVTPAWVDIHTHYDGQVTWDEEMNPSASHGVGTIVMGNCGVGFAPVKRGGERDLIELMEGVEDIPGTALYEGMPWGAWETYPEYLDFLAGRKYALNIASMIAHGAIRNYVLGPERGNDNASESEVERIAGIVEAALRAGAVGFSTSRIMAHRSIKGEQVPGTFAPEAELMAIAGAFRRVGAGVLQLIPAGTLGAMGEHALLEDEVEMICRLSAAAARPATFTLLETFSDPAQAQRILAMVKEGNRDGARVFPQVGSRPIGIVFSLGSYHPFMAKPSYLALAGLTLAELARALRDPSLKAKVLAEANVAPEHPGSMEALIPNVPFQMQQTFPLTADSTYEPLPEESFEARAQALGLPDGRSALYDHLVKGEGRDFAIAFFTGYSTYTLDSLRELQLDETTMVGLSDGGAHVGAIFDAANPTYQLAYWARDRKRGPTLPLAHVINRQTRRNAELFGFNDRGLVAPGMRADLNVIDFANLAMGDMRFQHDLPAGGGRLMQTARGYLATLIAGEVTRRFDQDTGARPGRLLRGQGAMRQAVPA
ncbi:MAG TPA: amidohydrolase family protein [Caulobacteraceae bacterium]|nr:amidohydrolase family protein [Caulobacteraceae bacterium]